MITAEALDPAVRQRDRAEQRARAEKDAPKAASAARREKTSLSQLEPGARAIVTRVVSASHEIDAVALRRLGELGFLPGEPVQLLRRGPGGREPIAVLIGETMFALRLLEAQCVEVSRAL